MTNNVISLFSGGGGLDMGFKKAGYNIIWAIDNDNNAVMTYKKNIGSHIICDDINTIDAKTIPNAQVLIGGPPCQSFSLSGKRDVEDARGQLVWRYIHIIEQIKPEAFVFENVTGLLSAKNKQNEKIIDLLTIAFEEIGYKIQMQVMNAADYGVPDIDLGEEIISTVSSLGTSGLINISLYPVVIPLLTFANWQNDVLNPSSVYLHIAELLTVSLFPITTMFLTLGVDLRLVFCNLRIITSTRALSVKA
jgi:hypothetical protein